MARYCELINVGTTPLAVREFRSVRVPADTTFRQGDVVAIGALSSTAGEDVVYECAAVVDATASGTFGIIVNQGVEVLDDGRTPAGNRNLADIEYIAGDIITVKLLYNEDYFLITEDCFTGTEEAGKYLITANGEVQLAVADDLTGSTTVAFAIEKLTQVPIGPDYEDAVRARVVVGL